MGCQLAVDGLSIIVELRGDGVHYELGSTRVFISSMVKYSSIDLNYG